VAYWLRQNDMVTEHVLQQAQGTALINSVLELQYLKKLNPTLAEDMLRSLSLDPIASSA